MTDEAPDLLTRVALPEADPATIAEQFAKKREVVANNRETNIPVPGYDSEPPILLARYRLLSGKELDLIGRAVVKNTPKDRQLRQQLVTVDIFCNAVVGFFYELGDGRPHPMTLQGEPIMGYNRQLAEALQYADKLEDPDDHRQVCFGLFAGNDVMMEKHSFVLNRWMGDTSIDVAKEMLMEGNF